MVVVVGGAGDGLTILSDVWLLDVTNRQWKQVCCYKVVSSVWKDNCGSNVCIRSKGCGSFPVCVSTVLICDSCN